MTELAGLIARLEGGETGREIDADVFRHVGYRVLFRDAEALQESWFSAFPTDDNSDRVPPKLLCVSTSLDAAVALVERVRPDMVYDIQFRPNRISVMRLNPDSGVWHVRSAPTPAAALVAALLRARTPDSQ